MKQFSFTISGGGLRSLAGLGALKYFEENYYDIVEISGTSGGSIISFLYALGYSPEEILDIFNNFNKYKIFIPTKKSLFNLNQLKNELIKLSKNRKFIRKFICCATDLKTGKPVYFSSEDLDIDILIMAVIASCSLIPFFPPVNINNRLFIDGGYSDNLPNIALSYNLENISINVNNISHELSLSPILLIKRLLLIIMNSNIKNSSQRADLYINIKALAHMNLFDFRKINFAYEEGYLAANYHSFENNRFEKIEFFQ
jgi:NTE family protein